MHAAVFAGRVVSVADEPVSTPDDTVWVEVPGQVSAQVGWQATWSDDAWAFTPSVPENVPNADMRIVLQGHFLPDGRSLFTAIQTMLQGNRDATAGLPDDSPPKRAALAAWTRWDMGNFFVRAEPMIAGIRDAFGFTDDQVDALFVEAAVS